MLYLLKIFLYKYEIKPFCKKIHSTYFYYNSGKQYFRLILKHIMIYYKNIFMTISENSFKNYKLNKNLITAATYKNEPFLKNFYC